MLNLVLVYKCGHKEFNKVQYKQERRVLNISKNVIRYSEEFKQQIVDLYQAGSSVTYLSRKYGIANVTIYKWIREFSNVKVSDTEIMSVKNMKKRIAELEMKNEILKKATAIFARNRQKKSLPSWKRIKNLYGKTHMQSLKIPKEYAL